MIFSLPSLIPSSSDSQYAIQPHPPAQSCCVLWRRRCSVSGIVSNLCAFNSLSDFFRFLSPRLASGMRVQPSEIHRLVKNKSFDLSCFCGDPATVFPFPKKESIIHGHTVAMCRHSANRRCKYFGMTFYSFFLLFILCSLSVDLTAAYADASFMLVYFPFEPIADRPLLRARTGESSSGSRRSRVSRSVLPGSRRIEQGVYYSLLNTKLLFVLLGLEQYITNHPDTYVDSAGEIHFDPRCKYRYMYVLTY